MITTSEVAVSVTIDSAVYLKEIVKELEPFGSIDVEKDHSIVSIVGNEIAKTEQMLGKLFDSLSDIPVRMVSYGGSPHNVSVLVPSAFRTETLQRLNKGLFNLG
jgi:aspartate kinase